MGLGSLFHGPGDKDFERMGIPNPHQPHAKHHPLNPPKPPPPPPPKSKGGGGGRKTAKPKPAKHAEPEPAGEPLDMSGKEHPKEEEKKPEKAVLTKIGWVKEKTLFNTDAEIFAEFKVPDSEKDRTLVDFQLLIDMDGEYVVAARAQSHIDKTGRATAKVPIRKDDSQESTFALKAKHCSQEDFADPRADRVVTDTAEITCEHIEVSGLHFPKDKSFIGDEYLGVLCEVKKTYLDWKKTHPNAQILIFGHSEADKDGEAHALSKARAIGLSLFDRRRGRLGPTRGEGAVGLLGATIHAA